MSKIYKKISLSSLKRLVRMNELSDHEVFVEFSAKLRGDSKHFWRISILKYGDIISDVRATRDNPWYNPETDDPSDYLVYRHPEFEEIDLASVDPEQGFWYSREC